VALFLLSFNLPPITKSQIPLNSIEDEIAVEVSISEGWKDKLLKTLYNLTPAAFERLSQRYCEKVDLSRLRLPESQATAESMERGLSE